MPTKTVELKSEFMVEVKPKEPFNFDATVHKPSYFPAPVEDNQEGVLWRTMRMDDKVLGLKMKNQGSVDAPLRAH